MDVASILKILAAVAAIFAAGVTVKTVVSRRSSTKSELKFVSQKNNTAGGDIVAGNSTKTNHK